MNDLQKPTISEIVYDVAANGDGWHAIENPEDNGRRARLFRKQSDVVDVEITVALDGETPYVHAGARVRMGNGRPQEVSVSVRNPINRRAIEAINAALDRYYSS